MDKNDYMIVLYDYYGALFTTVQKNYFEDYYFNNLSLSEMAENYNISRNAIHKVIKNVCEKLNYYESELNLYDKSIKINELLKSIDDDDLKEKLKHLY